jgi:hypothetical protein
MLPVPSCNCFMVHITSCVKLKHDLCTLLITLGKEHGWVYVLQIASRKLIEVATVMTLSAAILIALRALGT